MDSEGNSWKKRFEAADSERRELKELIEAIKSGQVDTIVAPQGLLRLQHMDLVTKNEQLIAELNLSNAKFQALLIAAGEGFIGINLSGDIYFVNPKACETLLIAEQDLLQSKIQDFMLLGERTQQSLDQFENSNPKSKPFSQEELLNTWRKTQVEQMLERGGQVNKTISVWHTQEGMEFYAEFSCKPINDHNQQCVGAVVIFHDISERKKLEQQLMLLANYDVLTGLANRALFLDSLNKAIQRQQRLEKTLAVMYLDMDNFKYINDQMGHDVGDAVLVMAAKILSKTVRQGDLVARLGGDEFAIVLFDVDDHQGAIKVAQNIIAALALPISLGGKGVNISFSIGISVLSAELPNCEKLIKAADTAMYVAKAEGRNNYQYFVSAMQAQSEQKHRIQTLMQKAITGNEFSLVFQPQVSLQSQKMIGCEALIRWTTASGESISPAIFIPIAEESGQVNEIGTWVLQKTCEQVAYWQKLPGFDELLVSINVSTGQLGKGLFFPILQSALLSNNIPASSIGIEITETGVMGRIDDVILELKQIHALGVKIAIDDFGTGSSSLELLRKLPLDTLKIDQSFIKDIGCDKQDEEIISVILGVAKLLGLEVVAEGVESLQQLLFLAEDDCDVIQGYYFSRPLCVEKMTHLITANAEEFKGILLEYEYIRLSEDHTQADKVIENSSPAEQQVKCLSATSMGRVLICEVESVFGQLMQLQLEQEGFQVSVCLNAADAFDLLKQQTYNVVTLNLHFDGDYGLNFLEKLRKTHTENELPALLVSNHFETKVFSASSQNKNIKGWLSRPFSEIELVKKVTELIA